MVVVSLGPGRFYGSSLPRPRFVKHKEQRVDPPPSVMDPLLSWAHDAHWSMGGLNFTRHRLQGRIEGNVDKLRAQRQHHHHKNNYTNSSSSSPKHKKPETTSSKRINKVETPSPPPAPVAIKRRRVVGLVDEEDEEIGVKRRRRRLVRKLGDDFERVARQTTSTSTSSKRNHAADDDDDVETINKRGKKLVKIGNRRSSPRLANKKKITRSN